MFKPAAMMLPVDVPPTILNISLELLFVLSSISASILAGTMPLIPPPSMLNTGIYFRSLTYSSSKTVSEYLFYRSSSLLSTSFLKCYSYPLQDQDDSPSN